MKHKRNKRLKGPLCVVLPRKTEHFKTNFHSRHISVHVADVAPSLKLLKNIIYHQLFSFKPHRNKYIFQTLSQNCWREPK